MHVARHHYATPAQGCARGTVYCCSHVTFTFVHDARGSPHGSAPMNGTARRRGTARTTPRDARCTLHVTTTRRQPKAARSRRCTVLAHGIHLRSCTRQPTRLHTHEPHADMPPNGSAATTLRRRSGATRVVCSSLPTADADAPVGDDAAAPNEPAYLGEVRDQVLSFDIPGDPDDPEGRPG